MKSTSDREGTTWIGKSQTPTTLAEMDKKENEELVWRIYGTQFSFTTKSMCDTVCSNSLGLIKN